MFIVKMVYCPLWQYAFLIVPGVRMPPEKSYPAVPCKWKGDMDMWWFTGQIH